MECSTCEDYNQQMKDLHDKIHEHKQTNNKLTQHKFKSDQ